MCMMVLVQRSELRELLVGVVWVLGTKLRFSCLVDRCFIICTVSPAPRVDS